MKKLEKITAIILAILLIIYSDVICMTVSAEGLGTEQSPYTIANAEELQNINDNVSAHYVLTADIDMQGIDFTPIGNVDSGAFSGSFDGNGYKILNLNVDSGKYSGLFGYNEGIIKNVTLSNVSVCGTRYIGGVVGHNASIGVIENCSVLSGEITAETGLSGIRVGGICGNNDGLFEGLFSNGSNITGQPGKYGGIIGYSSTSVSFTAENSGDIYSNGSAGGFIGEIVGNATITDSWNTGDISDSNVQGYSGGFIGNITGNATITNCYNTGNVFSSEYSGGFIGCIGYGKSTITNSYNTGNVFSYGDYSGGLVGIANYSSSTITNCYNTGYIESEEYSGGLIGRSNSASITNCYNTGNICTVNTYVSAVGSYSVYSGGLIGYEYSSVTVVDCYNTGNLYSSVADGEKHTGSIFAKDSHSSNLTSCFSLQDSYISNDSWFQRDGSATLKSNSELRLESTFTDWDFIDTWLINEKINGGYPVLQNSQSVLQLNVVNASMVCGESLQIVAYKNGKATNSVAWSVSVGDAIVNSSGVVTACRTGFATVTATDLDGNRANCNIYIMNRNSSVSAGDFSLNINASSYHSVTMGNSYSGDYVISATSSDTSIIEIKDFSESKIYVSSVSLGTATISFVTKQGFTGSCKATVTNYATSITINGGWSSLSVNKNETKQISCSTSPSGNTSAIVWTSSNPSVATIDQSGNVTGVSPGSTTITAKTDSGYSDTCTVDVYVPAESISFTETDIILVVGETYQTSIIKNPVDTTNYISYGSSASSIASVNSASGLITAKAAGTVTITATAGGVSTQMNVKVVNEIVEASSVKLNYNNKTLIVGDDFNLTAEVVPQDTLDKTVTFSTDDKNVATVDENGNVKATGEGTTIIRATASNGVSSSCVITVYGFTNVNGTPYFDIYAIEDLTLFRDYANKSSENAKSNARLMVDLDLSSVCGESLGSFIPIGTSNIPYSGTFDGNGHTISNLYINSTTYSGLFGYIGANSKVQSIVLKDVNVTGTNYVGGVAGKSDGTIEKVIVSGTITGTSYIGGISGSNTGSISYCGNTADLVATSIVGGVNGDSSSISTINNCYSSCEITASDYRQGGLAGINYGTISNSYYDNTLYTGSVVGRGNNTNCENSAKPSTDFECGEVTYLLNNGSDNFIYYQTIGSDLHPTLDNKHGKVYYGFENCGSATKIYTNSAVVSIRPEHNFIEGICTVCGAENNLLIVEKDMHVEGLLYGSNNVKWVFDELDIEDVYIECYDIIGNLLEETDLVGTATTINIYNSNTNELINSYTAVLYGDVNGDGLINDTDNEIITSVTTTMGTIENKWCLMAADVNHDGAVDAYDVIETELQTLDMHNINQKNNVAYLPKDETE